VHSKLSVAFYLGLTMTLVCPVLRSQTSQFTGQVSDQSGAVVSGASVQVANEATGVVQSSVSNQDGYYTIGSLIPGNYKISVSSQGFKTAIRSGIKLDIAQIGRVDFALEVGQMTQQITVVSQAPLLQAQAATVGQVVSRQFMLDLPLNGRVFTDLATLTPGAVGGGTGSFGNNPIVQVNGGRASQTIYTIDGTNTNAQFDAGTTIVPPPDAIQEFKVQTNAMSAEYGLEPAVISVALKSGANQFHGDAYDFVRNEKLDARNFFGLSRGKLRYNQFGGTLGGPVIKNRTFFFVDYQGLRQRNGGTNNNPTPTAVMRGGDLSAAGTDITDPTTGAQFVASSDPASPNFNQLCTNAPGCPNMIPSNRIVSPATYLLQFIPLPNTPGGNFVFTPSDPTTINQFDVRIDHRMSERDSLVYSQSFNRLTDYSSGAIPLNGGFTEEVQSQRYTLRESHTFGPSLLNEFQVGYVRDGYHAVQQGLGTNYADKAGIGGLDQTEAEDPGFPGIEFNNFVGLDWNTFKPKRRRVNTYEASDMLTKVQGAHTLKVGAYIRTMGNALTNGARSRGDFVFDGSYSGYDFSDYLLGLPIEGRRGFPRNEFGVSFRSESFYFQDDWKVTPRFTLNLGLRYDLYHMPTSLHNMFASVNPLTNQIVVASTAGGQMNFNSQQATQIVLPLFSSLIVPSSSVGLNNSLRHSDFNNFAPRLGAAWQPLHGLVVRAGYGIFYVLEDSDQAASPPQGNPPFIVDEPASSNTTPVPTRTLATFFPPITSYGAGIGPLGFFQIDPNRPVPYVQQWNFALQKSVGNFLVLEGAYVGSAGVKETMSLPVNIPSPGPGDIQPRRPNPGFSAGSFITNTGTASYNAFQAKAEIRSWHRLGLLAAYTWSKAIDGETGDFQGSPIPNPNCIICDRGLSDIDQPQRFTVAAVYALPELGSRSALVRNVAGGWRVTNIFSAISGQPFNLGVGHDYANTGRRGTERPDRLGSGRLANPTLQEWFDVSAFADPQDFTYGNAGRNILLGPGLVNSNLGIFKDFNLAWPSEGTKLEFRAEMFNFTNSSHFSGPVSNIDSSHAGQILSAYGERAIQFALKLMF